MNRFSLLLAFAGLAACSGKPGDPVSESPSATTESVVVAVFGFDEFDFDSLLAGFERQAGTDVSVKRLNSPADLDAFIRHDPQVAADVLVTASVGGVWKAADEGALRPLAVDLSTDVVPAGLRDTDGLWVGAGFRALGVAYDVRSAAGDFGTWDSLADLVPDGQLCLPAFSVPGTQALLGALVAERDPRPAERLARRWLASRAGPLRESGASVVEAVAAGECDAGIVALTGGAVGTDLTSTVRFAIPRPVIGDVAGIGVARHAANPVLANRLVEWVLLDSAFPGTTRGSRASGFGELDVAGPAWQGAEAALLAERAGWR